MNHPQPKGRCPLGDEVTTCQLEGTPSARPSTSLVSEPLDFLPSFPETLAWRYREPEL